MNLKAVRSGFTMNNLRDRVASVVDTFHRDEAGAAPAFVEPAVDDVVPEPVRTGIYLKARSKDEVSYSSDEKELIDESNRFRQALYAE